MKIKTAKEPVKIRFKKISNGNQSIYLDIYKEGERVYEFLKLYIVPENSDIEKEKNKKTLELVNKLKAKRILELDNEQHGFSENKESQKENFIKYINDFAETKNKNGSIRMSYSLKQLANQIELAKGKNVTFRNVTKGFVKDYIEHLKKSGLSAGSQNLYCKLFTVVVNKAMRDGKMTNNPMQLIEKSEIPKQPASEREFLTIEEIKALIKTDCANEQVKKAFLFVCFTGLRFSDVIKLKWENIQNDNDGRKVIRYTQKKTSKYELLQISDEATKYLPTESFSEYIFKLPQNGYTNQILAGWTLAAGIKKKVTFHVGRHTNATLLLSLGVPIETVSKILGHSDIKVTQIYAKVIDKSKREAADKLDSLNFNIE